MKFIKELNASSTLKAFFLVTMLFLISSCEVHLYDIPSSHSQRSYSFNGRAIDKHNMPISSVQILVNHWDINAGGEGKWHSITTDRDGYFSFKVRSGREGVLVLNGAIESGESMRYAQRGDNLFFNVVVFNFTTPQIGVTNGTIRIKKRGSKELNMSGTEPFDFRVGHTRMGKDYFHIMNKYRRGKFKAAAKSGKAYLRRYPNAGSEGRTEEIERMVEDSEAQVQANKADKTKRKKNNRSNNKSEETSSSAESNNSNNDAQESQGRVVAPSQSTGRVVAPAESTGRTVGRSSSGANVNVNVPSVSTDSASKKTVKVVVPVNEHQDEPAVVEPPRLSRAEQRAMDLAAVGCRSVVSQSDYLSSPGSYRGKCVEIRASFVKKLKKKKSIYMLGGDRIVLSGSTQLNGSFAGIVRPIGKKKIGKKGEKENLPHFNVILKD